MVEGRSPGDANEKRGERDDGAETGRERGGDVLKGVMNRHVEICRNIGSREKEQSCPITHLRVSTLPPTLAEWENGTTDCAQPDGYQGNHEGSHNNASPVPVVACHILGHK